jgi:hypothetical protein
MKERGHWDTVAQLDSNGELKKKNMMGNCRRDSSGSG